MPSWDDERIGSGEVNLVAVVAVSSGTLAGLDRVALADCDVSTCSVSVGTKSVDNVLLKDSLDVSVESRSSTPELVDTEVVLSRGKKFGPATCRNWRECPRTLVCVSKRFTCQGEDNLLMLPPIYRAGFRGR